MSTLNVRLPASLHAELKSVASEEEVSMNQMILLAVAEKLAARRMQRLLAPAGDLAARQERLAPNSRADLRGQLEAVMATRQDEAPVAGDELPPGL